VDSGWSTANLEYDYSFLTILEVVKLNSKDGPLTRTVQTIENHPVIYGVIFFCTVRDGAQRRESGRGFSYERSELENPVQSSRKFSAENYV
jgi:hypothetical protein